MAISISITTGSGYFGSVITQTGGGAGQWYADETPIAGATGSTYTMESVHEGKAITYRQTDPFLKSNMIKMWTPSAAGVAGLLADFDASLAANIVHTGGVVDSVTSRVGTWQLTQTTAADKPTYNATGRNGLPVISGDGTSDHFNIIVAGGTVLPVGTTPHTLMVMAHYANQTGDNWRSLSAWGSGGAGTSANRNLHKSSGEFVASGGSTGEDCITAVSWPNTDRLVAFEYTSTGKRIFVDGNTTPTTKAVALNTAAATIARVMRGITDYWRGGFQEYILFNTVLSGSDRQKTEGYLAHKWGKTASLPAGHPYKTTAPKMTVEATVAATGYLPTSDVLVDGTPPGPIVISVTTGTGYAGSVYTRDSAALGQWYASNLPIPGATGMTYTMEAQYEGSNIHFRAYTGYRSNRIKLFVPSDLSGLVVWFDAADTTRFTLVSNAVSEWRSRVGSYAWQQATAGNRPTWSATGRNSRPAVAGNGSSQWMQLNTPSTLPQGTALSHNFAVGHRPNVATGFKAIFTYGTTSVSTARQLTKNENDDRAGITNGSSPAHNFPTAAPAWLNVDKIVSGAFTATGDTAVIDGQYSQDKTFSQNTPVPDRAYLFVFTNGLGNWDGTVQDILIYSGNLTTEQRQKVEGYLASKWGLRGLLPVSHPYKTENPPPGGAEIAAVGYLPTAAVTVDIPAKASLDLNGLLPTMTAVADTEAPGPITISVTSGTGYVGSIYTRSNLGTGYWYVGGVRQTDETGTTLVMRSQWEGRQIQWRATNGSRSNIIDLFTPEEIPGLLAWFDTKSPATITHVAGVVSQVSSRRGGWTLTQAVEASKPLYSATGRNGLPAITADGVNDYFDLNTVGEGIPVGSNPAHLLGVGYHPGGVGAYRMLFKWGSVITARRGIARSNTGFVAAIGGSAGTNNATSYTWNGSDRIFSADYQGLGNIVNVDGGPDAVRAAVQNDTDAGDAYLFRDGSSYGGFSVQEFMIFNRSLTQAERESIEGYLAARWTLRSNLPVDHPYRNSSPPPKTAYDIPAFGFLPTADASGIVPYVIPDFSVPGYLPTADALAISAPVEFSGELEGLLPTTAATGKMQTRTWIEGLGLLPTAEVEAEWPYGVSIDWNGYLPTAALAVDFPIRATMEAWGYLAVAEIGGESVYEVELEANGLLPTAEVNTEVFQFLAMAEVDGYLPTMEAVMALTPKITAELENYLPFMQSEVVFPTKVEMDLNGLLPTMLAFAGPVLQPEIEAYGYLPTAEIEASVFAYEITAETFGYLPVSEIGGESVYEVEIDAMGLLPTTEALIDVPQQLDATVVAFGLLPTASIEVELRYAANVAGMGYLPTAAAEIGTPPVFVTLELMGYLPRGVGGGGSRPVANAPAAGTANSTLTVGGGPVLSRSAGLRVG